jgi:hypothetical protein
MALAQKIAITLFYATLADHSQASMTPGNHGLS